MPSCRFPRSLCLCALTVAAIAAPARAQAPQPVVPHTLHAAPDSTGFAAAKAEPLSVSELFTALGGDFKRLASRQSLFVAGLGLAASGTAHTWDGNVARSRWVGEGTAPVFAPGRLVGSFAVQTGGAFAAYVIGRTTHRPAVAMLGAELFRAQIVAQTTTQVLKLGTHRTRPDGTSLSLPSGHAAAGFATATVLQSRFGWKAGVPAYAVASWIAASRLQTQRHYLSDVLAGATIGILAGRSVTVGTRSTRFAVSPMVAPGGLGVSFVRIGH